MKKLMLSLLIIFCFIGSCYAGNLTVESQRQIFNGEQNKIYLDGGVKVKLDDIHVSSPRAQVNIDPETQKPESVDFLDNVYSYQEKGNKKQEIKANIMKLSLLNKVLTAEGNVQSSVTEGKKPTIVITAESQEYNNNTRSMTARGGVIVYYKDIQTFSSTAVVDLTDKNDIKKIDLIGSSSIKQKNSKVTAHKISYDAQREEAVANGDVFTDVNMEDGTAIKVWSNFQMYDKKANILVASGNTIIKYKDYTASGPKASVFPDKKTNKLNEAVFIGRSKIEEQGRTIEADRIKITGKPKNFAAEGNVKTFIPNLQSAQ